MVLVPLWQPNDDGSSTSCLDQNQGLLTHFHFFCVALLIKECLVRKITLLCQPSSSSGSLLHQLSYSLDGLIMIPSLLFPYMIYSSGVTLTPSIIHVAPLLFVVAHTKGVEVPIIAVGCRCAAVRQGAEHSVVSFLAAVCRNTSTTYIHTLKYSNLQRQVGCHHAISMIKAKSTTWD